MCSPLRRLSIGVNRTMDSLQTGSEAWITFRLGSFSDFEPRPSEVGSSPIAGTRRLHRRVAFAPWVNNSLHYPPWSGPNVRASINDMTRMPAPRTSTCWVLRRSKLPTRQTSR